MADLTFPDIQKPQVTKRTRGYAMHQDESTTGFIVQRPKGTLDGRSYTLSWGAIGIADLIILENFFSQTQLQGLTFSWSYPVETIDETYTFVFTSTEVSSEPADNLGTLFSAEVSIRRVYDAN